MESGVSQFTCGTWFICLLLIWMGDQISTCFHPNFLPNFLTWLPACLPQPREFWSVSFLLFVSWKQASYTWFSKQHLLSPPHHNFNMQPIEVWKQRCSICFLTLMFWDSGNLQFILQNWGTSLENRWYPHEPLPNCSDWGKSNTKAKV